MIRLILLLVLPFVIFIGRHPSCNVTYMKGPKGQQHDCHDVQCPNYHCQEWIIIRIRSRSSSSNCRCTTTSTRCPKDPSRHDTSISTRERMDRQKGEKMPIIIFSNGLIQPTAKMIKSRDLTLGIPIKLAPCQFTNLEGRTNMIVGIQDIVVRIIVIDGKSTGSNISGRSKRCNDPCDEAGSKGDVAQGPMNVGNRVIMNGLERIESEENNDPNSVDTQNINALLHTWR